MFCSRCGKPANAGARFCGACGVSLTPAVGAASSAVGSFPRAEAVAQASAATPTQRKPFEWIWPPVDTPESARYAVRQAFWAAIFVSGMTALVVFISAVAQPGDPRLRFSPLALVDAAMFGAISFGLWKESRGAAVAGLVLYILEQMYEMSVPGRPSRNFFLIAVLVCGFVGGIRGTFALHDFRIRGER